eukprot:6253325-Pyramimonas_sp.AAC.1
MPRALVSQVHGALPADGLASQADDETITVAALERDAMVAFCREHCRVQLASSRTEPRLRGPKLPTNT